MHIYIDVGEGLASSRAVVPPPLGGWAAGSGGGQEGGFLSAWNENGRPGFPPEPSATCLSLHLLRQNHPRPLQRHLATGLQKARQRQRRPHQPVQHVEPGDQRRLEGRDMTDDLAPGFAALDRPARRLPLLSEPVRGVPSQARGKRLDPRERGLGSRVEGLDPRGRGLARGSEGLDLGADLLPTARKKQPPSWTSPTPYRPTAQGGRHHRPLLRRPCWSVLVRVVLSASPSPGAGRRERGSGVRACYPAAP